MKSFFTFALLGLLLTSCASIQVSSDFDSKAPFAQYKTYAFLKEGIDKAEISDLDKKRILRSIEKQMSEKGYIPIKEWSDSDKPREKMIAQGKNSLSNAE